MVFNVKVNIFNCPDYAKGKRYIVARVVNGMFWFYGADDSEEWAINAINDLGDNAVMFDMKGA